VDGTLYFAAGDPETGYELWKSDGTAAGTVRVTDIYPGPIGSWRDQSYYAYTDYIAFPVAVNGRLFFGATHPFSGAELWALPLEPAVAPRCGDGHLDAGEDCDDGNPCTVDSCDAAGCRNDPLVGLDAIRCVFEGAGFASPVCAGQDVPPAAARRLERARQLIDTAEGARSARQVKRALRILRISVNRLGKTKRLSDGCAEAARGLLEDARRAATRWLDGR
jgi:ELWxxDGT repeat protein